MIKKIYLSEEANAVIEKLIASKDREEIGKIAAIEPITGEVYFGKSIAQAAKNGRETINKPKASFFYVKVGYPSVYDINKINLKEEKKVKAFPRKRKADKKIKECKPCVGITPVYVNKTINKNRTTTMLNFLI